MQRYGLAAITWLALGGQTALAQDEIARDHRERFGWASAFAVDPTRLPTEHLIPDAVLATRDMQIADLACRVGPAGRLTGCRVTWESVTDIGLCGAALAAAPQVQLKERFPDGGAVEGLFATLQMVFDVGGRPPFHIIPAAVHLWDEPTESTHPFDTRERRVSFSCEVEAPGANVVAERQ